MRIPTSSLSFPSSLGDFSAAALLGRARTAGLLDLRIHDLRDATTDARWSVDHAPFGGGAGMVLTPGPVFGAVEAAQPPRPLYLLDPGSPFRPDPGRGTGGPGRLPAGGFSLLCGRYEGVGTSGWWNIWSTVRSPFRDYVAGGEVAALVIIEAVSLGSCPGPWETRRRPPRKSFSSWPPQYPHYTRPAVFRGWRDRRSSATATTGGSSGGGGPGPCGGR